MPTTKAQQKAVHKYVKKNYARLEITIPVAQKPQLESYTRNNGETVNGYVNRLIREDMGISDEDWKRPTETDDDMLIAAANVAEPILSPSDGLEAEGE